MYNKTLVPILLVAIHVLCFHLGACANTTASRNDIWVQLDPYVSILDRGNQYRYKVNDLIPLVSTVATKFNRLFIELFIEDLRADAQTGLSLLPLAVASYNNQSGCNKLEVWLAYREGQEESTSSVWSVLETIANRANEIYNGTVTTLLLPFRVTLGSTEFFGVGYQSGIIVDSVASCSHNRGSALTFQPSVILRRVSSYRDQITELLSASKDIVQQCGFDGGDKPITTGVIITIPDTSSDGRVNVSRLVTSWNNVIIEKNRFPDITVVISKAFDTPYGLSVDEKTSGWWRLIENPVYNITLDYVFEEKAVIADQTDFVENSINFTFLEEETKFNKKYTGIVFSAYDQRRSIVSPYTEQEMQPIITSISKYFGDILVLIEHERLEDLPILLYELKAANAVAGKVNVSIMMLQGLKINKYFLGPIKETGAQFGFNGDIITSFVLPCCTEDTRVITNISRNNILKKHETSSYKLGYAFNISMCTSQQSSNKNENDIMDEALEIAQTLFIYFVEDQETVKLGATKMFHQRIVTVEACKAFLRETYPNGTRLLHFVMLHYATNIEFFSSSLSIQNMARYWELLSEWAGQTETNIILGNAVDGSRTFKRSGITNIVNEVGWWRYEENETNVWIDKKQEALRVAMEDIRKAGEERKSETTPQINPTSPYLDTEQILLIVLLPLLAAAILVALGLYVIRRHYRETFITTVELNDFFRGNELTTGDNEADEVYKVAYNKTGLEVDSKAFSVEIDGKLGSGEFGLVCRGRIQDGRGAVNVAVKMVNPQRFKKTTLSGLLSEIKLLAYVGNHENITELLGANTSDLKNGKVFIFLELCHLGSLEKYLHKVNPQVNPQQVTQMETDFNDGTRYVNTSSSRPLDSLLSDDLYRWCQEICNGMAYLASKHVVHADLATRNVLLNLRKHAKICDFGLSRRMYNYTNYVKEKQEPLPWKWMAPESLTLNVFNEKTDVWAYGVTLWEIYSLGGTPYPGLTWDQSFSQLLQHGFRLTEPQYNDQDMYSFMKFCWEFSADRRPSFAQLLSHLKAS